MQRKLIVTGVDAVNHFHTYTDPRFIRASIKRNGSPHSEEVNLDRTFESVVLKAHSDPRVINIPLLDPMYHLELYIRIPPRLPPRPRDNIVRMVIDLEQSLNTSMCDTPGLTLFTTDEHDGNNFHECTSLESRSCKFLCIGFNSQDSAGDLFMRMEMPVYGHWDMPSKIKGIKHSWLMN